MYSYQALEKFINWKSKLLTAGLRKPPNFLIIGTQKGGTTSIYNYLIQNPEIYKRKDKEVHFFDWYYEKGFSWYKAHFPYLWSKKVAGEATPHYMFHPHAINRIKQAYSNIKLIVILRNPRDRAFSQYYHSVRQGFEDRGIEEAFTYEMNLIQRNIDINKQKGSYFYEKRAYLTRGIYINQLQQIFKLFKRSRVLVLNFDDLILDPSSLMKKVFDFLSVRAFEINHDIVYNKGTKKTISAGLEEKVDEFYIPYNRKLFDLLGYSLDWQNG
jgi:hypothetical protein